MIEKIMKGKLAIVLMALLAGLMMPCIASAYEIVPLSLTNGGDTATAYLFFPTTPDFPGTVMPITFVYPNKTVTGADGALEYLVRTGIKDILEENGTFGVVFTPINATGYTEADVMIMNAAKGLFGGGGWAHNGMVFGMFGNQYAGSSFRTFVYADGAGADFISKYVTKRISYSVTFPDGFTMSFNYLPAAFALFNVNEKANPDQYKDPIPAFIVNGGKGVSKSYRDLNGWFYPTFSIKSPKHGITPMLAREAWDFMFPYQRTERTPGSFLITKYIVNYKKAGLVYTEHIRETIPEIGNGFRYTYFTYVPKGVKCMSKPMPMVMLFHGGGNSALYIAQTSDWLNVARKNKIIIVAVQAGVRDETGAPLPDPGPAEVDALRNYLIGQFNIDSTRVYATGFSMGSLMTSLLANNFPQNFAGFGPCNPAVGIGSTGMIAPSFGIMGIDDPLAGPFGMISPTAPNVKNLLTRNGCYVNPAVNELEPNLPPPAVPPATWTDPVWAYAPSSTETVSAYGGKNIYTISYYNTLSDGVAYTALCTVTNLSHDTIGATSWIQWEFFKKFSRNADGSIRVAPSHCHH